MKRALVLIAALLVAVSCARLPNTTQVILTKSLFDGTTIGGPDYPVIVTGAEAVGLSPINLAQSLRFPPRIGGTFRAVQDNPALINFARLKVSPDGDTGVVTGNLTFQHGSRRIGVGTFTLRREDFGNPAVVASTSASLIRSMLNRARNERRNDGKFVKTY